MKTKYTDDQLLAMRTRIELALPPSAGKEVLPGIFIEATQDLCDVSYKVHMPGSAYIAARIGDNTDMRKIEQEIEALHSLITAGQPKPKRRKYAAIGDRVVMAGESRPVVGMIMTAWTQPITGHALATVEYKDFEGNAQECKVSAMIHHNLDTDFLQALDILQPKRWILL